jgi:hypothetical protein
MMLCFQDLPRLIQKGIKMLAPLARFFLFTLEPFLLPYMLPSGKYPR